MKNACERSADESVLTWLWLPISRIGAMKVLLVLALVQLAFSFELTDPEWVAFKVSNRRSHVRSCQCWIKNGLYLRYVRE